MAGLYHHKSDHFSEFSQYFTLLRRVFGAMYNAILESIWITIRVVYIYWPVLDRPELLVVGWKGVLSSLFTAVSVTFIIHPCWFFIRFFDDPFVYMVRYFHSTEHGNIRLVSICLKTKFLYIYILSESLGILWRRILLIYYSFISLEEAESRRLPCSNLVWWAAHRHYWSLVWLAWKRSS